MIRISITDFYKYRVYHKYVHESQSVGQIEILQNEASLIWKHMLKVNNKVTRKTYMNFKVFANSNKQRRFSKTVTQDIDDYW